MWVQIRDGFFIFGSLVALVFFLNHSFDRKSAIPQSSEPLSQARLQVQSQDLASQLTQPLTHNETKEIQSEDEISPTSAPKERLEKSKVQKLDRRSKARMKKLLAKVKTSKLSPKAKEQILARIEGKLRRRIQESGKASDIRDSSASAPALSAAKSSKIAKSSGKFTGTKHASLSELQKVQKLKQLNLGSRKGSQKGGIQSAVKQIDEALYGSDVALRGQLPKDNPLDHDPSGLTKVQRADISDVMTDLRKDTRADQAPVDAPSGIAMSPIDSEDALSNSKSFSKNTAKAFRKSADPERGVVARVKDFIQEKFGMKQDDELKIEEMQNLAGSQKGEPVLADDASEASTYPAISGDNFQPRMQQAVRKSGHGANMKVAMRQEDSQGSASPISRPAGIQPRLQQGISNSKTVRGVEVLSKLDQKRAQEEAKRELESRIKHVETLFTDVNEDLGDDEYGADDSADFKKANKNIKLSKVDSKITAKTKNFGRRSELELASDFFEDIDSFIEEIETESP